MDKKRKLIVDFQNYLQENRNAHYRLAYSYSKHPEDAWDIIQTSIEKAIRAIQKSNFPESMNSWFYRILINSSLDYLRKNKRLIITDSSVLECMLEHEDQYENIDLEKAMEQIPTEIKTIITLRYFEDMKISDIALVLGQNENTIKTKLYRGLRLLRLELEEEI
ncbi:sigma-70 family RNA polymerase sigma factor [Fusibacter bizertensis]